MLQSSIRRPRGAWKFAYSRIITDISAQVIITMLTATMVGVKVCGSTKLRRIPGGGGPARTPDSCA